MRRAETSPPTGPQPVGSIAFPFLTIVIGLLVAACAGETNTQTTFEQPNTTTSANPTTTTTTTASDEDAFADQVSSIEAMVATRNSGDYEAWRAHFTPERPDMFGGPVIDESDLDWQRSFMAAGSEWVITGECSPRATGRVACPFTLRNGFHAPAGLWFDVPAMTFRFADDGLIAEMGASSWQIAGDPGDYNGAFDTWLAATHPEVYAGFGPPVDGENGLPNAADMPTALQYLDEFLAQSDTYPLGQVEAAADSLAPVVEGLGRGSFGSDVSGELSVMTGAQAIVSAFGSASDLVFAKITIPAGGAAPWHTHSGPALLLNVGPGTLTSAITGDCITEEIAPGSAFLDPGNDEPHVAVNNSDEDVVLYAAFIGVIENPVVGSDHSEVCELQAAS